MIETRWEIQWPKYIQADGYVDSGLTNWGGIDLYSIEVPIHQIWENSDVLRITFTLNLPTVDQQEVHSVKVYHE